MPLIIQHIDKIARDKGRDVLMLYFTHVLLTIENVKKYKEAYRRHFQRYYGFTDQYGNKLGRSYYFEAIEDYHDNPSRQTVIDWLDANHIYWCPCGEVASENGWNSYAGQIYIDIPFDVNNTQYQKLAEFIQEDEHGFSQKFDIVQFCYLPLEKAMENAHHDEPGFWERWAENF
jgi:hypothetical protein